MGFYQQRAGNSVPHIQQAKLFTQEWKVNSHGDDIFAAVFAVDRLP